MQQANDRLSIAMIIPTLNEAACVERAIEMGWKSGVDELIIADGGSIDETCQRARASNCLLVQSVAARATQQNAAAQQTQADVLLFMHADNWLASGAAEQIRQVLKNPSIAVGAFQQKIEAPGKLYRWLERGNAFRARRLKIPYGDQGIFIRRKLFEQVGRFPEVKLMEEVALMKQVNKQTRPILLPGPIHVDARRWQQYGIVRQTLRNWVLTLGYQIGISPETLVNHYPRNG